MSVIDQIKAKAKTNVKHIVLAEGDELLSAHLAIRQDIRDLLLQRIIGLELLHQLIDRCHDKPPHRQFVYAHQPAEHRLVQVASPLGLASVRTPDRATGQSRLRR